MTIINQLIRRLSDIISIGEQVKTAEIAKIFSLQQKAKNLFEVLNIFKINKLNLIILLYFISLAMKTSKSLRG